VDIILNCVFEFAGRRTKVFNQINLELSVERIAITSIYKSFFKDIKSKGGAL
jgi:hypothetical protein